MFAASTTYRSGSRSVEVLPGESHSDAWEYVLRGGPFPTRYPCSHDPRAVRIRRHTSHSPRRRERRRAAIAVP
jgi:hypothetical protein